MENSLEPRSDEDDGFDQPVELHPDRPGPVGDGANVSLALAPGPAQGCPLVANEGKLGSEGKAGWKEGKHV